MHTLTLEDKLLTMVPDVDYSHTHRQTMIANCKIMAKHGYPYFSLLKNTKKYWDVTEWCCDNFGSDNVTWAGPQFWFKKEEDLTFFILTWN